MGVDGDILHGKASEKATPVFVCLLIVHINSMFEVIGAVIGGLLGVLIPFLLAQNYVARGGDPTAAGAYSFFPIVTIPLGIVSGAVVGFIIRFIVKLSRK